MRFAFRPARMVLLVLGVCAGGSAMAWHGASHPEAAADYRSELNAMERHHYNDVRSGRDPWIAGELEHQAGRIRAGLHSGRISPEEARWLWREHRDIRQAERWAMDDGVLSRGEWQHLRHHLLRANRHIVRAWQDWDRPY